MRSTCDAAVPPHISHVRLNAAYAIARSALFAARNPGGWWTGELSTSALSTATAVMALELVRRSDSSPQHREQHRTEQADQPRHASGHHAHRHLPRAR